MKKVVMNDTTHKIFDFLIEIAKKQELITYSETTYAVYGYHTGRGLRKPLDMIDEYCVDNNLPILPTIVVAKGTKAPSKKSHEAFKRKHGDTDFEKWQNEVFNHDWENMHQPTLP